MKRICICSARALVSLGLVLSLCLPVWADGMPDRTPLRYEEGVFSAGDGVRGFFLTAVPAADQALLCLGDRLLRPGDAVPAADLPRLRLVPVTRTGAEAELCFLPVDAEGLREPAVLTMHIPSAENEAPRALDGSLETYRNIPAAGTLRGTDDGDGPLRFALTARPKRGTVDLAEDGSFTYTPKKNKVGEDSFTFTVTDAGGQVSAPATFRIRILKPTDAQTFADLAPEAQFPALWLRETGLFGGEEVNGRLSFGPDKEVTRGEFLVMLMAMEGIDPEIGLQRSGFADEADAPAWMRPYLASALRRGIIRGIRTEAGLCFLPERPVTVAEAAEMTARVLNLEPSVSASAPGQGSASSGVAALLGAAGVIWTGERQTLTRLEAARLLYQASILE